MTRILGRSTACAAPAAIARWDVSIAENQATATTAPPVKLLLRVDEARAVLSLNRNAMYRLLMSEVIYSFKEGGVRLIPAAELQTYVERRMAEKRPITSVPPLPRMLHLGKGRSKGVSHGS
jgi:hypothetical protein